MTAAPHAAGVVAALTRWDGRPAHHATRVATGWDDEGLAVVFTCADRDAWATHLEHDAPLWQEEVVEVFLAPGPSDPVRYFELELNPRGTLFDALVDNPNSRRDDLVVDLAWFGPGIRTRVDAPAERRYPEDWRAAFWLPWADLGAAPLPWCLRANFYRIERPRSPADGPEEFAAWSPTLTPRPDFHQPRRFGLLLLAGHPQAGAVPTGPGAWLNVPRLDDRELAPEVANFCQFLGKRL